MKKNRVAIIGPGVMGQEFTDQVSELEKIISLFRKGKFKKRFKIAMIVDYKDRGQSLADILNYKYIEDHTFNKKNHIKLKNNRKAFTGKHVRYDGKYIWIGKQKIEYVVSNNPFEIDFDSACDGKGIQTILEATGRWKIREDLEKFFHKKSKRLKHIFLTHPTDDDSIPMYVYGVTEFVQSNIYSLASCSTNALLPILEMIIDNFKSKEVKYVLAHSDHALTGNKAKFFNTPVTNKLEFSYSSLGNVIQTSTGASKAVPKMLSKDLAVLISCNRLPIQRGSLFTVQIHFNRKVTVDDVHHWKNYIEDNNLQYAIGLSDFDHYPLTAVVGKKFSSVIPMSYITYYHDFIKMSVYYDNVSGYVANGLRSMVDILERKEDSFTNLNFKRA